MQIQTKYNFDRMALKQLLALPFRFLIDLIHNWFTIAELTKRDFKNMYVGSTLGILWTFIQPLAMILILWVVFSLGFKSKPLGDVPFVIYLITGLIPWNYFSEALVKSTSVIHEYSYIVKKIPFRISILPIVKIGSALIVYAIFLFILIVFLVAYEMPFSVYWLQSFYYLFAASVLLLAYSWFFAALNVFFKDVAQTIGIAVQVGFWLTPIFWNLTMFPESFHFYFRLNPMYYIIEGFRDSFIHFVPFWEKPELTLYFWGGTIVTLLISIFTFSKLRSHFADVL